MITSLTSTFSERLVNFARQLGGGGLLVSDIAKEFFRRPHYFGLTLEQIYHIGVQSIGLIMITAVCEGSVMALQFGLGLAKFGGKLYVPKIISLSLVREMVPVFCSLMLAARVGAGIASEIGSMTVTQQIDAIRALGTSPIKRIVIPRLLACAIALPLLCALGNIAGIFGSFLVGVYELGLDPMFYVLKVMATVIVKDVMTGLFKTVFFAFFIGITACYFGLNVRGGTQGVGLATTRSVVASSVMILIGDYFLTKLMFILFD